MNARTTEHSAAASDGGCKVSSGDRLWMYGIEKWPSSPDDQWQRKMNEARSAAAQRGLNAKLVQAAAIMGILRLVRTADEFRTGMFEKVRAFMKEHEIAISEVIDEMHHRIETIALAFDLSAEQIGRAVQIGLDSYIQGGGSPEFAVKLADAMEIAEEDRSFLQLGIEL
jgi:hypothetical protein